MLSTALRSPRLRQRAPLRPSRVLPAQRRPCRQRGVAAAARASASSPFDGAPAEGDGFGGLLLGGDALLPLGDFDRVFDRQMTQMQRDFRRLDELAAQLQRDADAAAQQGGSGSAGGPVQRQRELSSEWRSPSGAVTGRSYYRESIIVYGAPQPAALGARSDTAADPLSLAALGLLLGMWAGLTSMLVKNWKRTTFKDAYRLPFAVLWPLLALFSASFREQLARVIRDTDGGSAPPPPPRRAEDAKE